MMTPTAGLLLGGAWAPRTTPNVGCLRIEDTDTSNKEIVRAAGYLQQNSHVMPLFIRADGLGIWPMSRYIYKFIMTVSDLDMRPDSEAVCSRKDVPGACLVECSYPVLGISLSEWPGVFVLKTRAPSLAPRP